MTILGEALVEVGADMSQFDRQLQSGMNKSAAKAKKASGAFKGLGDDIGRAGKAAKGAGTKTDGLSDSVSKLGTTTGRARDSSGRFVKSTEDASAGIGGVTQKARLAIPSIGDLGDKLQEAGEKARRTGETLQRVGSELMRELTLPILGVSVAAVKLAVDFEASMTQITALVGIPREQVQAWGDDVRDLAIDYGKSATEASEALYFITSAGIDAADAMAVLDVALKASTAGLGDTQTLADALTSAMNAYESVNLSAAEAADILTAAVKYGKLEATELAPVLGRLLPTSSALGITFADVAGTLAVMSRTGLDAAEASTSLNAVMSTLLKPSAEAAKLLEANGLSMKELREQAAGPGGLIGVMRTLSTTFGENDEELAAIVPNVRAFRGVMNVLAQDAAGVDEVMRGVANASGSLDAAFSEVAMTAKFQMAQTLSTVKDLLLEIGQTIVPIVVAGMGNLRAAVEKVSAWWGGLSDAQREFAIYAAGAVAAIGPLLLALGSMSKIAGAAISGIAGLSSLFGPWGIAIGLVGAAIAALVIGGDDIEAMADKAINAITGFAEKIPEYVPKIVDGFVGIVDELAEALPVFIEAGVDILIAIVEGIVDNIDVIIDGLLKVVDGLLRAIVKILPRLVEAGVKLILALVDGIVKALPDIIKAVTDMVVYLIEAIVAMLPELIDAALTLFLGLVDGLIAALPVIIEGIMTAIPTIVAALMSALPEITKAAIQLFLGIGQGLIEALPTLIEMIFTELIPGLIAATLSAVGQFFQAGKDMLTATWDGMREVAKGIWDWITETAKSWAAILNPFAWADPTVVSGQPRDYFNILEDEAARQASGMSVQEWAAKGKASATNSQLAAALSKGGSGGGGGGAKSVNLTVTNNYTSPVTPEEARRIAEASTKGALNQLAMEASLR